MQKLIIPAKNENIPDGIDFIRSTLTKYKIKRKSMMKTLLIAEESMVRLMGKAPDDAKLQIIIRRYYNNATVVLSAKGSAFETRALGIDVAETELGHDSEEAIRSMLLHAMEDNISYYRRGGHNFVKIHTGISEQITFFRCGLALLLSIVLSGILTLVLPESVTKIISDEVLLPLQTVFIHLLSLVTAPAVFFSIMVNVSRYMALTDPDRVSQRIIVGYLITSAFAVVIGIIISILLGENQGLESILAEAVTKYGEGENDITSVLGTFAEMVPSNIVSPFMSSNPIQLLVIAIIAGIALGRSNHYSPLLVEMADALDKFFSDIAGIAGHLIPIASFFVTSLMILSFGFSAIVLTLKVIGAVIIGFVVLFLLYIIFLVVAARVNPITFLRKTYKVAVSTLFRGSSIASIEDTTACCEKKLGVSAKVCGFSIPFGAIANLDGNCIYLTVAGLFLAKMCGVNLLGSDIVTISLMVIILSVGSPITPGSAIIALTMLLGQMGVSISVISIVLGVDAFVEMVLAACNTVGDMVTSVVIAKQENLLDMDVYNKK